MNATEKLIETYEKMQGITTEKKEIIMDIMDKIKEVVDALNVIAETEGKAKGYTIINKWEVKDKGKKFIYLDVGGSGAFLVERATGELYNIKGYGVADKNKKMKADIGNIWTVNPEILYTKRWNYLR